MGVLLKLIDTLMGSVLIIIFSICKYLTSFIKPKNKNILIIRLRSLGESILTLPLIKKLKDENFEISVLCSKENVEIFKRVEFVDEIFIIENLKWIKLFKKFDYSIDTEPFSRISAALSFFFGKKSIGFSNTAIRRLVYNFGINYKEIHSVYNFSMLLTPLGIKFKPKNLIELKYSKDEVEKVEKILKALNKRVLIGMHVSTGETSVWRAWKPKKWAKLIEKIIKNYKNIAIILTGTKFDRNINKKVINLVKNENVIDLSGKFNLGELSYLMKKLKVFISNDTGPMHLAAAQGCKVIGLFGPNLPERFAPFKGIAIYKAEKLSCSPCINVHKGEFKKCKYNGKCMDLIKVDDVFKEISQIL